MRPYALLVSSALLLFAPACAVTKHEVVDPQVAAASSEAQFEFMKSLEGTWEGKAMSGEQSSPTVVHYRITGAGSAVEETLFPGTEHEMVSVYHRDGPWLMMTHYCSAGNQPRMRAVHSQPPVQAPHHVRIHFQFLDASNLASPEVLHMHEALFEQDERDQLRASWTAWKDGKADHTAVFELRRKGS